MANVSQGYKPGQHPAWDMFQPSKTYGYGTPLCAPEDCKVIFLKGDTYTPNDDSGLKNGYGIWLKGLETGQTHFFWHTLPVFPTSVGQTIKRGHIVAYMGNAGLVYSGGAYVPVEERLSTKKGTHLHWEVYDDKYRLGGKKRFVDFTNQVDFTLQPVYTNVDQLKATTVTLAKIAKLLKK